MKTATFTFELFNLFPFSKKQVQFTYLCHDGTCSKEKTVLPLVKSAKTLLLEKSQKTFILRTLTNATCTRLTNIAFKIYYKTDLMLCMKDKKLGKLMC